MSATRRWQILTINAALQGTTHRVDRGRDPDPEHKDLATAYVTISRPITVAPRTGHRCAPSLLLLDPARGSDAEPAHQSPGLSGSGQDVARTIPDNSGITRLHHCSSECSRYTSR
jgi:hypothetical protein